MNAARLTIANLRAANTNPSPSEGEGRVRVEISRGCQCSACQALAANGLMPGIERRAGRRQPPGDTRRSREDLAFS